MKFSGTTAGASLTALLLLAACSKTAEPIAETRAKPTSAELAPEATASAHHAAATPGSAPARPAAPQDVAWDVPAAWVTTPNPNTMRIATYKIPKAAGDAEDAEMTVSAFAGGVDPNVKRWEQQFGDATAKREPRTVNGLSVTVVEIKGKFAGGGMGAPSAPKDGQMLLGAVVETGDRQHFFKMVGPQKTVAAARKDFDKLVGSLRPK